MVIAAPLILGQHRPKSLSTDERGSVLIEAAVAVPLLISLLFGILVYGNWFMTAHSLQQAANEAARAAVAGLDGTERRSLVDQSLAVSRAAFPMPGAETITVSTSDANSYYTVTLRYDLANAPIFAATPFPLPSASLQRSAIVQIVGR